MVVVGAPAAAAPMSNTNATVMMRIAFSFAA
jgi:hypothetical protein